ncbi:IclR family transcriptional regulator C-terminal domain-containing protein [Actinomadura sp. SCN-SB]|uniref:IclR family transcriptional regulator domain-containing protein n=1 Tax=Actinomadura sp. SCN-SB TaxID=3373092 RepID=UPI0037510119
MTAVPPGERSQEFVRSLERGLSVIKAFDADHPRMTLSEVARAANLSPAAARRFLLTLVDLGYLANDDGVFSVLPSVLSLGYPQLSNLSLPDIVQPYLEDVATELRAASSLTMLDGDDAVYLARASADQPMTLAVNVGSRLPAFATAAGRVLLAGKPDDELDAYLERVVLRPLTPFTIVDPAALRAELLKVRAQGWSLVDQELEEGVVAVAVPLRWRGDQLVGALNSSTHTTRVPVEQTLRTLLAPLQATAARIEADLRVYPSLYRPRALGS